VPNYTVSDSFNAKLNSMIANVTSEITKRKVRMSQEFSTRLQTEVQSIAKEVEVVKKSTDMEVTNCLRNVESVCVTECMKVSTPINAD
jgi:hypothetical protein